MAIKNFLDTLAEKYGADALITNAVKATAEDLGMKVDLESFANSTRIMYQSTYLSWPALPSNEIPFELRGSGNVRLYKGEKDGQDYILGIPVKAPYQANVFCTSPIKEVKVVSISENAASVVTTYTVVTVTGGIVIDVTTSRAA